jgi:hypothetical protein
MNGARLLLALGALLPALLRVAPATASNNYPPGPGGTCLDSVTVYRIQNTAAACHPVDGDTVLGLGGIVVGINPKTVNGAKIYIASNPAGPWQGVQLFNGNTTYPSLAIGDSVVWEFGVRSTFRGETEVLGYGGTLSPVQKLNILSHANPVPMHTDDAHQFQRGYPNANPNADQWEGSLVRCAGPLRVARQITGSPSTAFLAVDNTVCPLSTPPTTICDSVYVDGYALTPTSSPIISPALNAVITDATGIYGIDNRPLPTGSGWKIMLRRDWIGDPVPPPMPGAAYSVHDDTIRVIFDRAVTQATGENVANYQLADLSHPVSATLEADGRAVNLYVPASLPLGAVQSVTVSNLAAVNGWLVMPAPVTLSFYTGVLAVHDIRIPNPDSLAALPCLDKSRFAGGGSALGGVLTVRGTCIGAFGASPYIQDNATGARTGVQVYTAGWMQLGRRYLVVGCVQESNGETDVTAILYARDEGVVSQPPVTTVPVSTLRNEGCNSTPVLKDYIGQLVKLDHVKSVNDMKNKLECPANTGHCFTASPHTFIFVAGYNPTFTDTVEVFDDPNTTWAQAPDSNAWMSVTGVVRYDSRYYTHGRVTPRTDADFTYYGVLGVPTTAVNTVSFAVHPNPARIATVDFALPRQAEVDLSVFDLGGRKVATLAKGSFSAGPYTRQWNGAGVGSGVYFVRLRVGAETYSIRTVRIE